MRLVQPTAMDLCLIAATLCENDQRHFCAMTGLSAYEPDAAARHLSALSGPAFCLLSDDGRPVAAGGYEAIGFGVFRAWMAVSIDGWGLHWRALTKAARRTMSAVLAGGARRVEAETLADNPKAVEWYEKGLCMAREGFHMARYADGSNSVSFGRIK